MHYPPEDVARLGQAQAARWAAGRVRESVVG